MVATSAAVAKQDSIVCPCCGGFIAGELNEETGWCDGCSTSVENQEKRITKWLEVNADHIEYHLSRGLSYRQAVLAVNGDTRPTCGICGKPMARAKRSAVICRRTSQCKRASRRYIYLYTEKGYSKAEALALVLGDS